MFKSFNQSTPKNSIPQFTRPEFKKNVTPLNLAEFNIKNNPDYPVALLGDISKRNLENEFVTWKETGGAIDRAAKYMLQSWKPKSNRAREESPRIIGILAPGDPLAYFSVLLGIMKMGSIPFAISTRNSPAAIAHLLPKAKCDCVLVPFDPHLPGSLPEKSSRTQVSEVLELLPTEYPIYLRKMPTSSDLFSKLNPNKGVNTEEDHYDPIYSKSASLNDEEIPDNKTLLILHSSGSTKFPKPIYLTRATLRAGMNTHNFTDFPWKGQITTTLALPPYHSMFFHVGFYPVLYEGSISGVFRPELMEDGTVQSPSVNSFTVMKGMMKLNCTLGAFTPSMLVEFSEDPASIKFLTGMAQVGFGGGPLRPDVGDLLSKNGVKLTPIYGLTETGVVTHFFPPLRPADQWEYFSFSPHITPQLIPHGENEYELVILSSEKHRASVESEDQELSFQAFRTNDLLVKHPTLPLYRVIGRLDDQIMLSTSEKTNPGPLEAILCFNRAVAAALMFGRARPQNGVLIEPAPGYEVDLKDSSAVEKYIDRIWPSVEELNKFAPSHSRLIRNLIILVDPRVRPLARTPKGPVARPISLELFKNEIEMAYLKLDGKMPPIKSAALNIAQDKAVQTPDEKVSSTIKEIVEEVIGQKVDKTADVFKYGCDSLHASQIRSKVLKICQDMVGPSVFVPQNILYQNPTVEQLSDWVIKLIPQSVNQELGDETALTLNNIQEMIEKYKPTPLKVVLVTGTTGSLGAHVFEDLLQNREVEHIYALNRSSKKSLSDHERHFQSFEERGLDVNLLKDYRITYLTADKIEDLPHEVRRELSQALTHILHISYPVNFNLSLKSFEPSIALTKGLADLLRGSSLRPQLSKPIFLFASSVATIANHSAPEDQWVDEAEIELSSCLGGGYGESKRVCEKILEACAQEYGFTSVILRIAQLCGSRKNGAWNKNEWFPLIVQSGVELGCLPDGADEIAWIPVDDSAKALNDIALYQRNEPNSNKQNVFRHLVHPKPTHWHQIIVTLAELVNSIRAQRDEDNGPVKLVSYQEWLEKLSKFSQDNPSKSSLGKVGALKILVHFQAQLKSGGVRLEGCREGFEAMGVRRLVTTKSENESPYLRECLPLNDEDAIGWFKYWQENKLL